MKTQQEIDQHIAYLEQEGLIDPNCPSCKETYECLRQGKGFPFAPRHQASARCESGKHPHCSCDTCF